MKPSVFVCRHPLLAASMFNKQLFCSLKNVRTLTANCIVTTSGDSPLHRWRSCSAAVREAVPKTTQPSSSLMTFARRCGGDCIKLHRISSPRVSEKRHKRTRKPPRLRDQAAWSSDRDVDSHFIFLQLHSCRIRIRMRIRILH